MLENGYIKTYRSLVEWEWYKDTNTKSVFIHLLLTANYEDKKWKGKTILRGQRATSYQKLADELNLSVQNIRTAIKHLISTDEITSNKNSEYSLFTIKNYNKFQEATSEVTNNQQATNKQLTSDQQATNNKERKIKKDKESKKDKNINTELLKAVDDFTENEKLKSEIREFIEYRASIKKALTQLALKKILDQLTKWKYTEEQCGECLNNSIMNGWQGIFELKNKTNKFTNNIQRLMKEAEQEDEQKRNNTNTNNLSF